MRLLTEVYIVIINFFLLSYDQLCFYCSVLYYVVVFIVDSVIQGKAGGVFGWKRYCIHFGCGGIGCWLR